MNLPASSMAANEFFGRSGAFLVGTPAPASIVTPEDLGDEHRAIARTADEFWTRDVAPRLDALRRHESGVGRELVGKAAALGLIGMQIPEAYGGLALDLRSVILAIEHLAKDASYLGWHLGQSGIGSLPLVYFGTDDQKRRYLPSLASADLIGAYALTEPHAGSDALAARTRADRSPDGRHYVLNGQKAWITNGGEADLFTVFAKVDGEAFTAFLVERAFGVTSGPEEHKMGLTGTSTTALFFDNVAVPVENLLGSIGRGHIVALNVLNVGRLEIGPLAIGGARDVLSASVAYTRTRRAFGHAVADYGAIQQKLADCAIGIYMTESATWRVVGLIEAHHAKSAAGAQSGAAHPELAAFEEFAAECAMIKVFASEMLDAVADEGVQMHGGYGYHRDSLVERAYRDARINRIFEGTNEINRLVIPPLLLKRAARGGVPLLETVATWPGESGQPADGAELIARAKALSLGILSLAHERHGADLKFHQEVVMGIADLIIDTFVLESGWLRSEKLAGTGRAGLTRDICAVHSRVVMDRMAHVARQVLPSLAHGAELDRGLDAVRRLTAYLPFDVIAARQRIAKALP